MHYLYLYIISVVVYLLMIAFHFIRGFRKKSRYDYWTAGYLFDSDRSAMHRTGLFLIYTLGVFFILVLYETTQDLTIPFIE